MLLCSDGVLHSEHVVIACNAFCSDDDDDDGLPMEVSESQNILLFGGPRWDHLYFGTKNKEPRHQEPRTKNPRAIFPEKK